MQRHARTGNQIRFLPGSGSPPHARTDASPEQATHARALGGLRPAAEYRAVTDEEWQEFLGHFERRKLALGQCGRAYGSSCVHEHACVRCAVLIVGPGERPRLEEIRENLHARITEAKREGWLGDVEQLTVSLAATEDKIGQIDANERRRNSPVFVGMPPISQLVVRDAESRDKTD